MMLRLMLRHVVPRLSFSAQVSIIRSVGQNTLSAVRVLDAIERHDGTRYVDILRTLNRLPELA